MNRLLIGCVREIKDNEYRVGLVPGGVKALVNTYAGKLTCAPVAEAQGLAATPLTEILRA